MNQTLVNDNCPYRWQYRIGGHVTVEPFFRRHIFKHPRSSIGKLVTNGTRCDREIIEFCKSTPNLQLEVSLDGIGAAQEYLRPGLSWPLVEENLKMFDANGVNFKIASKLHVFSVFSIKELEQWCATNKYEMSIDILLKPEILTVSNMPYQLHKFVPDNYKSLLDNDINLDCVNVINDLDRLHGTEITDVFPQWSEVFKKLHWKNFHELTMINNEISKYVG